MKVYVGEDYKGMSRKAANIISAQVILKPDSVLGLATGSTPIGTYEQLVEWYKKGDLDFSQVTSVNLDEYKGLSSDNNQSYHYFMKKHLFDMVNINQEKTYVPNGLEPDSKKACEEYNSIINDLGGIDLQLLGLGHNGHIGFNEPGEAFEKETHCVDLTQSTIEASNMISKDVLVISWENHYQNVYDLLKNGFKVINCSWQPLYVVSGIFEHERYHFEDILDWNVYEWKHWWLESDASLNPIQIQPTEQVLEAQICAWGLTYEREIQRIVENLAALSEHSWSVKRICNKYDYQNKAYKILDKIYMLISEE